MPNYETYRVKVLEKAFRILSLFDERGKALTVKEISELLEYNKSSALRIIRNLEEFAYLERVEGSQAYKLGFGIYTLGQLAESYEHIRKAAKPYLEELWRLCGETVHLAVMHNGQALYIDKIESTRTLRIISRVGASLHCHCSGVGKVLLSALNKKQLMGVIDEWGLPKKTENTFTDISAFQEELERIRENGYALDNEEIEYGLKCVAAPVRNELGKVVAAVSISGPRDRIDADLEEYRKKVVETAEMISKKIGYEG
jgi:DNA-binding IclR family transcriptional regulator